MYAFSIKSMAWSKIKGSITRGTTVSSSRKKGRGVMDTYLETSSTTVS